MDRDQALHLLGMLSDTVQSMVGNSQAMQQAIVQAQGQVVTLQQQLAEAEAEIARLQAAAAPPKDGPS